MKTAMQELIEHMEYFKDYSAFARDTIKKATELLDKEKYQIKKTYISGFSNGMNGVLITDENYYQKTYNHNL